MLIMVFGLACVILGIYLIIASLENKSLLLEPFLIFLYIGIAQAIIITIVGFFWPNILH